MTSAGPTGREMLPSRARSRGGLAGVSLEAAVDGVADLPLESPGRFFAGLALGDPLVVVGPAVAVAVPDLADRGHVDGMVQAAVPAPGQPADRLVPRRRLNRRGAVTGREMVPAGEAGHVGDVVDRCDSGGGPARNFWFWHPRSPRQMDCTHVQAAASAW